MVSTDFSPTNEAGGAPFTLFCPGTLRNLQSPWLRSHSSSYANAIKWISCLLSTSKSPVFRAKSVITLILADLGALNMSKGNNVVSNLAFVTASLISSITRGIV